jgi:MFS family permease
MLGTRLFCPMSSSDPYSSSFSSLGDSPVLSAALSEAADPAYLGTAFGLRSLLGFGAGAVAPLVFGLVLDWTNPATIGRLYAYWGWAFSSLGLIGLGATVVAFVYKRGSTPVAH